jgi:asparagine synthase (glutamine-hydrolysing)
LIERGFIGMCGIYGIWHRDGQPVELPNLQQATATLHHRGPDDEGYLLVDPKRDQLFHCGGSDSYERLHLPPLATFADAQVELAFGFRRLAILDLSPAGHQPMASGDGRYWIIYNGEVYNYVELRQELQALGHTFHTGTDTEVILAAYGEWGSGCLHRFNGMWAFAIWDRIEQRLFLARDRFGVKPLYYVNQGQTFAFGSEIKALVGGHGLPFRPNGKMIYRYILANILPNPQLPETFFEGVLSLPPGHHLTVDRVGLTVQRYWHLPYAQAVTSPADVDGLVAAYREQFTDAVRLRLRADVPVGTCLSGGLDSSSIVCTLNQMLSAGSADEPFHQNGMERAGQQTFSAVYTTPGRHNERPYIEQVLQRAPGVEGHFTIPTAERLHADLHRYLWHQDEPCLSTSPFAQWCVMQEARANGVTVLLDGQGADETLAGYRPYGVFLLELLQQGGWAHLPQAMRTIGNVTGLAPHTLLQQTLLASVPDGTFMTGRRLWWRNQGLFDLFQPAFADRWQTSIADGYPYEKATSLGQHLHFKLLVSLPELLRYEDRNSMAHSIEARVPFLDYRLVEFTFTQVAALRIRDGWTKWVLRKAMEDIVPQEIVWRRDKIGFETPQNDWVAALLQLEPDLFGPGAYSGEYLNLTTVRQRLSTLQQERGKPNRSLLWRLINLELWLRLWQGSSPLNPAQSRVATVPVQ